MSSRLHKLLMKCAKDIDELGHKAFTAENDKYEILVTIKTKDKK